jgi:hypothetical protein
MHLSIDALRTSCRGGTSHMHSLTTSNVDVWQIVAHMQGYIAAPMPPAISRGTQDFVITNAPTLDKAIV